MKSEQIQQQILKILFGLKQMNSSLTIMSNGWIGDRPLNPTMLQTFVEQLHKLLQKSILFSSNRHIDISTPILQLNQQSVKSYTSQQQQTKQSKQRSYQIRIQNQSNDPTQIDVVELVNLNHELSEQNQQLTKKLEEAGTRIIALEDEINLMEKSNVCYKQEGSLSWENRKLRMELDKAQELLVINNSQFIQQIQKYNQRIWRSQRMIQSYKVKILEQKAQLQERDFIISKLKLKNMDLQMNSRVRVRGESNQGTERSHLQFMRVSKDKQRQINRQKDKEKEKEKDREKYKQIQFSRFKSL